MRIFFDKSRLKWLERFEAMEDEVGIKVFLNDLIDQYNIQNYSKKIDDENGEVWQYNKPDKRVTKLENNREIKDTFSLSTIIICSEVIRNGTILSEEKLESFWQRLQQISNLSFPKSKEEVGVEECAICGLIAVLLENNDWLEKYPDRKEWCIKKICNILSCPLGPTEFNNSVSFHCKYPWSNFHTRIIPKLWARNPDSPELRQFIAMLVMDYNYETVEIMSRECSKFREILGDNFKQLQHFIHLWSVTKKRLEFDSKFDLNTWIQEEFKSFINGSMIKEIQKWDEIEYEVPFNRINPIEGGKTRIRRIPGLDLTLIESAYDWLSSLDYAVNDDERLEWINFWNENLQYTLKLLGDSIEDDREIEGTTSSWDRWVFSHVCALILELKPSECPMNFWEPILNLGVTGKHWIKAFFVYWFSSGLHKKEKSNAFLTEWNRMIEYAFSSPRWDPEKNKGSEKIWCSLIGFDHIVRDLWTADQKYLIKQMYSQYERWAKKYLNRTYCSSEFISFIQMPGAEYLALDGLIWLDEAATDGFWNNQEIQKKLPPFLEMVWTSYQSRIRQRREYFESFKNLLKGLAETQNQYAMELQDRILIG